MAKNSKPLVLAVLDGFGVSEDPGSTFLEANLPNIRKIEKNFPFTTLQASGIAVGLPWGEEGNSEVGHLTIGAGRVLYHHLPRIIVSIQDGTFFENPAFVEVAEHAKKRSSRLHLMGLFSSGSVHAYVDHLYALLEFSKRQEIGQVFLHLFTDGRDAPPKEALTFIQNLIWRLEKNFPAAKIASLVGRDFSMDRDGNWGRIEKAYRLFAEGKGNGFQNPESYLDSEYKSGRSDEFIEPGYLTGSDGKPEGRIQTGDGVIFFNFREDSAIELSSAFVADGFDHFPREKIADLAFATLTRYDDKLPVLVAFPPLDISYPLARVISENNLKQLHVAETEKYAHVTYFFNGGIEKPYELEDRILVPSLQGAHFDEHPEMSADKICENILEKIGDYDFILVNFANGDMVGHTGSFDATRKALEILDEKIGQIMEKVLELGGILVITGDHGNAEEKRYRVSGEKRTKHTSNPVPFYLIGEQFKNQKEKEPDEIRRVYSKVGGVLTDVAPTVLDLMGLKTPEEMRGVSLLKKIGIMGREN
ncbi:2,3-bisphosphoglycerate-independent phosphoglycerate mutase [Candidatus Giovannonibacteria bacterium]|nr:2,3-bisphosphoglycerate-independent phosphoglycerate mutase [Candidatus Giovannonibacteria bacterium]